MSLTREDVESLSDRKVDTRQRTGMNDPWTWTTVWELTVGVAVEMGRRGQRGKKIGQL